MDVPKSFRPENVPEENIKQLLEEPKYKDKRLETLLNEFSNTHYYKSEFFHKAVEELALKKDYKLLNNQSRIGWDYWTKSKNQNESYVLIRKNKKKRKYYSLATVENNNLEKFCKTLEDLESYKKFYNFMSQLDVLAHNKDIYYPLLGALTCILFFASTHIIATDVLEIKQDMTTALDCTFTVLGGYIGFSSRGLHNYLKNKKNYKKIHKERITDEKEAIKRAFS